MQIGSVCMNRPDTYVAYHVHSMLSNGTTNIDSITNFRDYVKAAKECGMPALGISEHGNIFEWLHKKEAIEKAGMKYLHCVEAYLTEDSDSKPHLYSAVDIKNSALRDEDVRIKFYKSWKTEDGKLLAETVDDGRIAWIDSNTIKDEGMQKNKDNYHVILIAKNYEGVKEINRLVSKSFCRTGYHFYYMPRISLEELFRSSDNIIVTTACLGGVLNNGTTVAKEKMLSFLTENKDRCFLEIQHHNYGEQIQYNRLLYEIHKATGIPLIVGTDTHALNDDHMDGRAMLQKAKNVRFANEDAWDLKFKTTEQLIESYKKQNSLPMEVVYEAINNTVKMSNMVEEFALNYEAKYPKLYADSERVFKEKINNGVKRRGIQSYPNYKEYVDRIHYEYDTYKHNNAIDFMLLEEDYKTEMRKRNIKFGYSRGSVSGSIIAYLLGITEIDSVKFKLNFERFMNKERVSLADIDTDWLSEDRKIVKDYLYRKKGLYCCDIVTFNTIAMKGAIRDMGRALGIPLAEVDEICAKVNTDEESLRKQYKELFKYVDLVNGVVVSVGNHPAGCVVSPFPVDEWFGTFTTATDDYPISSLNMKEIDSLNFVKLDILGLDNIGLIYKTCELVGIPFLTPDNTPGDDIDVWNSIKDDTTMIFQWESQLATTYLKQLFSESTISNIKKKNPNFSYMDLFSIGNSAIRPAGKSYRDKLAQGIYQDNGHKVLNDFLAPTLGYLVYQEQLIEFLHKFCGFTMGEADIVRRHFSKKTGTEEDIPIIKDGGCMPGKEDHYIKGFIKTMKDEYGVDEEKSEKIIGNFLQVIIDASDYLFSKNHSDPYSWIGYICGYLRYYYPIEFITTALNIFEGNEEKSLAIINYAKQRKVKISPIKFRYSIAKYNFRKETNEIYKGISSIKFMNVAVANEIYELRNNQYETFIDLLYDLKIKTSINAKQLKILIELDFFSEFGDANYLLKLYELFDLFDGRVQIKKSELKELNIPIDKAQGFARKETAKMLFEVDIKGFLRQIALEQRYNRRTLYEKIQSQIKHLGYIDIVGEEYKGMGAILSIDTKYAPKLKVYSLKNGIVVDCKIDRRTYSQCKLEVGDIIRIQKQKRKPKLKRLENGRYEPVTGVDELWLTSYKKVNNV